MFEYGEKLYKGRTSSNWDPLVYFRYRMDPVPGTSWRWGYQFRIWYKTGVNCLQEKREYYAYPEYTRRKRSPKSLPNDWDDRQRGDVDTRRSWKNKKVKKQWQKNL